MQPTTSRVVWAVSVLERSLRISVKFGFRVSILLAAWFFIYVIVGYFARSFGWFNPGYEFLSLKTDPIFISSALVMGLSIAQTSGSLILYHFLVGTDNEKGAISILMAYIGLGFGAALIRLTLPPAIQLSHILI